VRFTIEGAPRTKKNSLRRIRRGIRTFTVSSEAHEAWEKSAVLQLQARHHKEAAASLLHLGYPGQPCAVPVNLCATIYRVKDVGDLGNYLAAICDALEKAGVVENDRLIGGFDGSRLLTDAKRPRVEIALRPL
jgi:Holliday junction resolvase RusA-like endonuclease